MKFVDHYPTFNASGYAFTNEEPVLFAKALDESGRTFQRAASICSGGEVPLQIIAPRVQELIAIDHSYAALAAAMTKALLLRHLGAKDFRNHIMNGAQFSKDLVTTVQKDLPSVLQQRWRYFDYTAPHFQSYWTLEEAHLQTILDSLDKITFVHGDLNDLPNFGTFDLLYISNAWDHTNRERQKLGLSIKAAAPGALVLLSQDVSAQLPQHSWKLRAEGGKARGWFHRAYEIAA